MRFEFEVGDTEKHRVKFYRDFWFGNVTIETDDQTIVSTGNMIFGFPLLKEYKFILGEGEKHKVRIECLIPRVFGLRKLTYRVFVDGKMIQEHRGP